MPCIKLYTALFNLRKGPMIAPEGSSCTRSFFANFPQDSGYRTMIFPRIGPYIAVNGKR